MTSYPRGPAALRADGPRVAIRVGPSRLAEAALRRAGARVPEPIGITALVDTGSGRSVIQKGLARALGLTPMGAVEIDTPSSSDMAAMEYQVRFWFDGNQGCEASVLEAPLPVPEVRALIGRDVLANGRFEYEGTEGWFSLELTRGPSPDLPSIPPSR